MSPGERTELMAKVIIPEKIKCPTPTCVGTALRHYDLSKSCFNPGCLWFFCDVCERTTWFTPKESVGTLGRRVLRWGVRASRRLA